MSDEHSLSLCRASPEHRDFDLPPPDTKRWVTRRKAVVVNAVRTGVISLEEVCRRYEVSVDEFLAWERAIDTHGVPGLRVTRLQSYRDTPPSRCDEPYPLVASVRAHLPANGCGYRHLLIEAESRICRQYR